jgi:hypothetical protein
MDAIKVIVVSTDGSRGCVHQCFGFLFYAAVGTMRSFCTLVAKRNFCLDAVGDVMFNTVGYDTSTVHQDNLVAVYGVWTHESGRYVLGASLFSKKEKKL